MTSIPIKANILIDNGGSARIADFGLLRVISDPTSLLPSSSYTLGGTVRWMSPELLNPKRFGLDKARPSKTSDCYALAMVIYETITGHLPFHEHTDLNVVVKVLKGVRPRRGPGFADNLWKMLGLCWGSEPGTRPSATDVLQCLETISNPSESPSSPANEETWGGGDDWDSTSGSFGMYLSPLCQSCDVFWSHYYDFLLRYLGTLTAVDWFYPRLGFHYCRARHPVREEVQAVEANLDVRVAGRV